MPEADINLQPLSLFDLVSVKNLKTPIFFFMNKGGSFFFVAVIPAVFIQNPKNHQVEIIGEQSEKN
ncbi:hypothetical protein LAD59_12490 [Klebsiella pneumoniae]|nr:hypothetical protein [Klebsiella pneumoniae]